jgi:hypothetical protein
MTRDHLFVMNDPTVSAVALLYVPKETTTGPKSSGGRTPRMAFQHVRPVAG